MTPAESQAGTPEPHEPFAPPRPTLVATALFAVWVAILSLPMVSGRFLAGEFSDQYDTGFAFRDWLASEWKRSREIPLWNPELFGGMPFVGAMHGDIFYPTSWLRLLLPTDGDGIILEGTHARACAGKADAAVGDVLHAMTLGLFRRAERFMSA